MGSTQISSVNRFFRNTIGSVLFYMPKKLARSVWFNKQHGYKMDFRNPQTLDEKLNWLLVNYMGKEHGIYADKVGVRDYVTEKGWEELLPEIYGIWSRADEIPLDKLPNRFVLKCNHASGDAYYEIVRDKSAVDWPSVLDRMEHMLHTNYGKMRCQYQYNYIKPCVYAEEFLEDGRGARMTDYKVFCYYGKPHCIMACAGRGSDLRRAFYDVEWNFLDYAKNNAPEDKQMAKPKGLATMLEAAAALSQEFPFARMDFYDVDGKVYFGEITLTPDNCNIQHLSKEGQRILGDLLDLDPVKH